MPVSWLVLIDPGLTLKQGGAERGIFVKNYIDQSQEFALCAVVLAYPIITLLRDRKIWQALLLMAIAASFVANMVFVIVSRTAMVTMPVMLAVFALMHLKWRTNVILFSAAIVIGALAWTASPQLQATTEKFSREYRLYKEFNQADIDRVAAGILGEVAALLCRGADHRARHRIDARAVRGGRHRS